MLRAHVAIDIGACLPALEGDEPTGFRQALMKLVAEAAGLAAGGVDAGCGGLDEGFPGIGADLDAGDDEKRIGQKARLRNATDESGYAAEARADARASAPPGDFGKLSPDRIFIQ